MSKERLREARKAAHMTQKQLAEASGVPLQSIQRYEGGFRDIGGASAVQVLKIAKALGTTVEAIIE